MKRILLVCTLMVTAALGYWGYASLVTDETEKDTSLKTSGELHRERVASKKLKRQQQAKTSHPEMFAAIHREIRTREGEAYPGYTTGSLIRELNKARAQQAKFAARQMRTHAAVDFVERGPGNVAGRTRIVIPMPQDPTENTWLAGSVAGGVWKTTDSGQTWELITPELPNLATTTIAFSDSNPDIIYVGTGESFAGDGVNGSGMFKSTDGGDTWSLLNSTTTITALENINRIIVDPSDPDYVVVCGRQSNFGLDFASEILVSEDGGMTWTTTFDSDGTVQHVIADPTDFSVQYASVFNDGVYKSTDAGQTWTRSSRGLVSGGRIELAIAPTNNSVLYASAQGNVSGSGGSDMFISRDAGATWKVLLEENDGGNIDHLGGQGGYDNCVIVNPFNENIVYAGGVNMFKFEVLDGEINGEPIVSDVIEDGTDAFMDYVNFGAGFSGGRFDVGSAFQDAAANVEVRFGPGETQMAHRFTVGNNGSGVPPTGYTYEDYVDVPFTVWDVDTDRQLMVSFRDQQDNGVWDLISQNTDGDPSTHSREYVFVHDVTYSATADASIAQDGSATTGQEFRQLYFYWPFLADGAAAFDADNLPASTLRIEVSEIDGLTRRSTVISDAYSDFNSNNSFTNAEFENRVGGIHPDHHYVTTFKHDEATGEFSLLVVNDGGVYYSETSANPSETDGTFEYAGFGYNTSQFYGADKRKGMDQYIGGMQDNSTWYTPLDQQANAETQYKFAVGGDGFEALWNKADANKMMGSIQFNAFRRSLDGGRTWSVATNGMTNTGSGNGAPFISRLSNHPDNPDRVYALGADGIWISEDWGGEWELTPITENYSIRGDNEVKISIADPNIVWTGGAMVETSRVFVSTDAGQSFTAVPNFADVTLGSLTGIATHPTEPNTAYVIFSISDTPKILRTTDLGQTWEDISGFGLNDESDNGFPDVAVYSLLVFPWDTDRLWAGTEIGIFESLDNGENWALLDCNLPATAVWQMLLVDDQVVIATHGRGIWTASFPEQVVVTPAILSAYTNLESDLALQVSLQEDFDSIEVYIDGVLQGVVDDPASGIGSITIDFDNDGEIDVQVIGYVGGQAVESNELSTTFRSFGDVVDSYGSDLDDSPVNDFISEGIDFAQPTSFVNSGFHSPHPYAPNSDLSFTLRSPIRVGGEITTILYEDVAIVEPGAEGSSFGEQGFFDYVVVEGTKDGLNWIPLGDGYDATLDSEWLNRWNRNGTGSRAFFVEQSIDLLDFFEEGDVVAIRFRMSTDGSGNGWGWAVDNIYIQQEKPAVVNGLENEKLNNQLGVEIFPVPAASALDATVRYFLPTAGQASLRIMSVSGQLMEQFDAGVQPRGEYEYQLNSALETGVYLVQIQQGNAVETRKMIIR